MYQLVLQYHNYSEDSYARLVHLEEALLSLFSDTGNLAVVDGHDFGAGEMNIFVLTETPHQVFERIRQSGFWPQLSDGLKAAFRDVKEDTYSLLWPDGQSTFEVK